MFELVSTVDSKVQAALVAAVASVFVALLSAGVGLITLRASRSTAQSVEVLKDGLASRSRERDAMRDYEYAARRRLYSDCEPVIFRFLETCDAARTRIARMAGYNPALQPLDFAKSTDDRLSTLYRLIAPIAEFAILRERLTMFDLSLEPRIYAEYSLGRLAVDAFHEDAHLAALKPALLYQPGGRPGFGKKADPAIYSRQGISPEEIDQLLDALIERRPSGDRIMAYQQFRNQARSRGAVKDMVIRLAYLLQDFTPERRPVFWRILRAQHGMYTSLRLAGQLNSGAISLAVPEDEPLATGNADFDRATEEASRTFLEERFSRVQKIVDRPATRLTGT